MQLSESSIIERIIEGLREIFPETEKSNFTAQTTLGEMPEWDSMAAVNLQTYLQRQFEIEVPLELLSDETTLVEIVTFLKSPISNEVV